MSKLTTALMLAASVALATGCVQTTDRTRAASTTPTRLTAEQARAEHDRVEAVYKADKEACDRFKDNAKDICQAEAKAKERVANAEVNYRESGSDTDRVKVAETRASAEYDVAKERCEDKPRDAQDLCKKDAKAAEMAAISRAKMNAPSR